MKKQLNAKEVAQEIKALKTLMNVYLSRNQSHITKEQLEVMINNVIAAHCTIQGITIQEFLSAVPSAIDRLVNHVQERRLVSYNVGEALTKYDKKTIKEKKRQFKNLRSSMEWKHWEAYAEYLLETKHRPEEAIEKLNEDTDNILCFLPNPKETKDFFIRGLVVGYVQSGKTTNYAAVINKAIDLGYEIVIVLAGLSSMLRNQTQKRMELEVVGLDTATGQPIGVGERLKSSIEILTKQDKKEPHGTKDHNGDITADRIRNLPTYQGNKQIMLVVKKNKDVLTFLYNWLSTLPIVGKSGFIENHSLLLINDESDQASINNSKPNEEPSTINDIIRNILNLFKKKVVIGYTASPFADIFLDPTEKDDLFPEDFIYLLEPPTDYIGPLEFFGFKADNKVSKPMPLVIETDELDRGYFTDEKSVRDWNFDVNGLNPSLKAAINSFILSGAIRGLRGQKDEHHSMLIHISVSKDSHESVRNATQRYIDDIKSSIPNFSFERFWLQIKDLWTTNYLPRTEAMNKIDTNIFNQEVSYNVNFTLDEIKKEVVNFLQTLQKVHKINSEKDADLLDYDGFLEKNGTGMKVICVGGSQLGRGFTIEGLTCSYYARNSLQVDTVLQCGRYYGYRQGYRDLVRVYTSNDNKKILELSAQAVYNLLEQFKSMIKTNKTPKAFGFYMEQMLDGILKPTSRMRRYEPVDSSYSGKSLEVGSFILNDEVTQHNLDATEKFIYSLKEPSNKNDISWRHVPSEEVINYLKELKISKYSRFKEVQPLGDYIAEVSEKYHHLQYFDVVLVKLSRGGKAIKIAGHKILTAKRHADRVPDDDNYYILSKGRAVTTRHLTKGLSQVEEELLMKRYPERNGLYKEEHIRDVRNDRGFLAIYTYCSDEINRTLNLKGDDKINKDPIGFYISLPVCEEYESRKSYANLVYYLNNILGGNVV